MACSRESQPSSLQPPRWQRRAAVGGTPATGSIGAGLRGPTDLHAAVYVRGLTHVSALTFDADGRLWATTSGSATHASDGIYLVARAGARPVKVVSGLVAPLGLAWVGQRLVVSSLGACHGVLGLRRLALPPKHGDPARAGRRRREQQPRARAEREARDGRLGVVRPLRPCVEVVGRDRLVPARRQRPAARRAQGACRVRARVPPGTSTLFATMNQRDDLGVEDAGRLARSGPRGAGLGFPELLRPGRRRRVRRSRSPRPCSTHTPPPAGLRSCRASSVRATGTRRSSPSGRPVWSSGCRSRTTNTGTASTLRDRLPASPARAHRRRRRARRRLGHRDRLPVDLLNDPARCRPGSLKEMNEL